MTESTTPLPAPPHDLAAGDVVLRLDSTVPADPSRDHVPYYHFRILTIEGLDIGHINFRVGNTDHVRFFAGHIGFMIHEPFRGHGYARQACEAIVPLVRTVCENVIITCDPDNIPSRRTIERLGGVFIDEVAVPPDDPHFQQGSRCKRRYAWSP
jgi:predicted acetyltransferase